MPCLSSVYFELADTLRWLRVIDVWVQSGHEMAEISAGVKGSVFQWVSRGWVQLSYLRTTPCQVGIWQKWHNFVFLPTASRIEGPTETEPSTMTTTSTTTDYSVELTTARSSSQPPLPSSKPSFLQKDILLIVIPSAVVLIVIFLIIVTVGVMICFCYAKSPQLERCRLIVLSWYFMWLCAIFMQTVFIHFAIFQ